MSSSSSSSPPASSRLIVKNLPAYLSDTRLKEHFSQKGLVTDVKLMTRPDGTSRRFGFVGYRDAEQAQQALEYFNRTFIDTSRIQVELARRVGDEELAARKEARRGERGERERGSEHGQVLKPSEASGSGGSAATTTPTPAGKKRKDKTAANSSASAKGVSFEEFLAVMAPSKKRKTWQNEEDAPEVKLQSGAGGDDDGDAADRADKQKRREAKREKKRQRGEQGDGKAHVKADGNANADADATPAPAPADVDSADTAANDEGLTDMEYMARRMRRNVGKEGAGEGGDDGGEAKKAPLPQREFEQSDDEGEDGNEDSDSSDSDGDSETTESPAAIALREEKARKDAEAVDTIMASGRLFVRNLPFSVGEDELGEYFAQYGPVKQTHIPLDKTTKSSKGLAFVTFADASHALSAYRAADGSFFQGRLLHLLPAVDLRAPPEQPRTLKQSKADERKARADADFNWSMLYMSADAVASSVADRLGVSKAEILNPGDDGGERGDSAAVRLALAETRVIQETKEFLVNEGIDVSVLEGGGGGGGSGKPARAGARTARSDTTILVKNIPYGTPPSTIREMFERHGEVDRVLIPPTGTLALVEMTVPGEARVAFKALAYKRVGNSVLYLEKAPEGLFTKKAGEGDAKAAPKTVAPPPAPVSGSESAASPGATLFVKNLSFATTDATLAHLFSTIPDFAFARVQTRVDARSGARLSMGYGFVGYRSVSAAQTALTTLHNHDLDGHALSLSFARRGQDDDDGGAGDGKKAGASAGRTSTKLLVKNLPFEATKKDVRALFASHGQLKSVRVPRKAASLAGAAGGGARGFAFVEFTTKKEAESAFEALRHTHLLGRHLVLVWDHEDGQDVEGMRAKVKESFEGVAGGAAAASRRRKEKLKLGEEDIAAASAREREQREDVD